MGRRRWCSEEDDGRGRRGGGPGAGRRAGSSSGCCGTDARRRPGRGRRGAARRRRGRCATSTATPPPSGWVSMTSGTARRPQSSASTSMPCSRPAVDRDAAVALPAGDGGRAVQRARRRLVGVGRGRVRPSAAPPVNVYRMDDGLDLGEVADALADAGLEESDRTATGGSPRTRTRPTTPAWSTASLRAAELLDVTVVEEEHLLVVGSEPARRPRRGRGDADSLADDDGLAALRDRTESTEYALVFLGQEAVLRRSGRARPRRRHPRDHGTGA